MKKYIFSNEKKQGIEILAANESVAREIYSQHYKIPYTSCVYAGEIPTTP